MSAERPAEPIMERTFRTTAARDAFLARRYADRRIAGDGSLPGLYDVPRKPPLRLIVLGKTIALFGRWAIQCDRHGYLYLRDNGYVR